MRHVVCLVVLLTLTVVTAQPASAGGLVGNFYHWVADRTGLKPIGQVGDALDSIHAKIKEAIPPYGQIEEAGSAEVRKRFLDLCSAGFHAIIDTFGAHCANYGGRMDGQNLIAKAKVTLVNLGFYKQNDFGGVDIRVCPLSKGTAGLTPDRDKILLDTSTLNDPTFSLVATLGHEMLHHRQYIEMGTDHFKCDYTREYMSHSTTRSNALESPAYALQDQIEAKLNGQLAVGVPRSAVLAARTKINAPIVHLINDTSREIRLTLESEKGQPTKFVLKKSDWNEYHAFPGDTSFNVSAIYIDNNGMKHLMAKNVQAGFSYKFVEEDGQLDVRSE